MVRRLSLGFMAAVRPSPRRKTPLSGHRGRNSGLYSQSEELRVLSPGQRPGYNGRMLFFQPEVKG